MEAPTDMKKRFPVEDVLEQETVETKEVFLITTDRTYPYMIVLMEDKEVINSSVNYETREEADEAFENTVETFSTDKVAQAVDYMSDHDFTVVETNREQYYDVLVCRRGSMRFGIKMPDVNNENYRFISRHWDIITSVVRRFEEQDDVFHSTLFDVIEKELPYAKEASRSIVYQTVAEILDNIGVKIHS